MEQLQTPLAKLYLWEQSTPNKLFMRQPVNGQWRDFTWKDTAEEVRKLAAVLQSYGFPPKSRVALVSKNCAHWLIADLAIMMAGYESIPIYPNSGADTLNYVIKHSDSKILLVGKLDDWSFMKDGVPEGVQCISFPWYGPKQEGFHYWEDLVKKFEPLQGTPDRNLEDVMTIIYTSGTTGTPKGVIHTYYNCAWAVTTGISFFNLKAGEVKLFSYLPLSHIAERMLVEIAGVYINAEIWFAESLDLFVKNLAEAKPTLFFAVPRIWTKFQMGILAKLSQSKLNILLAIPFVKTIIANKIKEGLGLNNCIHYMSGAAPISPSLISWWTKLGTQIEEVYGMTENCAISHINKISDFKAGTQGKPLPGVEVKLSDAGEILMKVPCNMKGYYREPEMTATALQDGWLHTGDRAIIDSDGFLKITGRVKELFKTDKGKYVSPAPIEMKISKNQLVEQVCVVGSNLPQPIGLVVLSDEGRTKDREYLKHSLAKTLELINPELEKHERVHRLVILKDEWTIENGLLTPTLKIKRNPIEDKYHGFYNSWYANPDSVVFEN
ncbi:MAG: AMP-dependent synthetase [Bacteroidota bacterium]|nr:AMP-dependent synthetase [Bacteroidota bacterium]